MAWLISQTHLLLVLCALESFVVTHESPMQPTFRTPSAYVVLRELTDEHSLLSTDLDFLRHQDAIAPQGAAMLQSSNSRRGNSHAEKDIRQKEIPPYWFNGFSKSESTFDPDGEGDHPKGPEYLASQVVSQQKSLITHDRPLYMMGSDIPGDWFEESDSGGPTRAWQTRYPPLPEAHHAQKFLPERHSVAALGSMFDSKELKDPLWFDESIANFDIFGRITAPTEKSDRWYAANNWTDQSWSVKLGCEKPGCIANASLKTFDANNWQHARCKLHFGVHATDFDDEYSRENVEWLYVNNQRVMSLCDPMAKGCNKSVPETERGLHSCVSDLPLDHLLRSGGTLNLASKISPMVDECPVLNNLLSGEARVTCKLKPWPKPLPPPMIPTPPPVGKLVIQDSCSSNNHTTLRCTDSGCAANTTFTPCRQPIKGEKCMLTIKIWQTDFDEDHGSVELVEWVKVDGKEVAKTLKPGRNPCKEVFNGKAPSNESLAAWHAARNGTPTNHTLRESWEDITEGMLAPMPGVNRGCPQCRRRIWNSKQAWSSSFLKRQAEKHDDRNFTHLRADPDEPKTIVQNQDVTKEILATGSILVEAKISDMVDECGKDGYLLNADVHVDCK